MIFDCIERLEIAIRTQITYQLSHKYGAHWQDKSDIFKDSKLKNRNNIFNEIQTHINKKMTERDSKSERFITHYKSNYYKPENPPSWMCVEIMYFSHLSKICNSLKERKDIVGIAKYFNLDPKTFCSWLHSINYVRNLCAHHARLWNRTLSITPSIFESSNHNIWISNPNTVLQKKLYYFLCMINYMLQSVNPQSNFKNKLIDLLDEYSEYVEEKRMGFPENWRNEAIWEIAKTHFQTKK